MNDAKLVPTTDVIPDDLIEIRDPEIDVSKIMEQIRERVRRRREQLGEVKRAFPQFDVTLCPEEPADIPIDANLYHHLRVANRIYAQANTNLVLVPTRTSQIPVVGRVWQRFRAWVHNLILFYVNRAITEQVSVNRHLVSVVNQLTLQNQEQQRMIVQLQHDIKILCELEPGQED